MDKHQSAAMLIIGNEILSGRTRDANGWLTAQKLFDCGCRLAEIAIVPDIQHTIVESLNRLRNGYDAVITSGGIGPTHDDITMSAVADAFGVKLIEHRYIMQAMNEYYGKDGMNEGRRRMSRVPEGARLIRCEKTIAPGAHIGNVYMLAGVPDIFTSQLDAILPDFGGTPWQRREIEVALPESSFANMLSRIQAEFPEVEIGSYPSQCGQRPQGKICLSSQNPAQINEVENRVRMMLETLATASHA
ncbi:MAG: molybdopterin-binding protein [Mariprofundaceae bacterium]|nr:molybdopterin-binding protein [Mariprofundaceae bacterium]